MRALQTAPLDLRALWRVASPAHAVRHSSPVQSSPLNTDSRKERLSCSSYKVTSNKGLPPRPHKRLKQPSARMRSEGYGTWFVSVCVCVCPFICYHVFCDYAQRNNEIAIPTGSSLHWPHFKKGDLCITTTFKSYGVKSKSTSQYAN